MTPVAPDNPVATQSALGNIEEIRTTLAGVANIDDFLADPDAAERTIRLYLST